MKKVGILFFILFLFVGCGKKSYDMEIVAFLEKDLSPKEIQELSLKIKEIDGVKKVTLRSKEEIKNEMMESSETYDKILSNREDNPFHEELHIMINGNASNITAKIEQLDGIASVKGG